ncbi:ABC transporter permease [Porcincola intestinalis]|uniref:Transport permease protein n=1 Tax=Porcincola intestinalis TaxID=2606632 RepID=A0A6L5X1Y7_9FIRM|nr:ABC transporter permease [Porcincola intestinalis]MSS14429.1 ABC transporter permease [Porcincola intestinalis]
MKNIVEIYSYRDMIWSLVRRELRGKYEKSVLGFLWAFLGPLFQILIYSLVFTNIFHNNMPNFYIFLMSGILPWTFFSDSLGQGTGAIIYNAEMVKKIYFPREVLVISEVIAKLINMLLSFAVMAVFLVISGIGFSDQIVLLPIVVLIELILCLGASFFVSAITVYFRDLEYVIQVVLMAWIWATPIMYSLDDVTYPMKRILFLNPLTQVITCYHDILYFHRWTAPREYLIPLIEGIVILMIGYSVFNKIKKRFAEEL